MLYNYIYIKFKEKLRYADRIQKEACLRRKGYWIGKGRARGTFRDNKNVLHLDLDGGDTCGHICKNSFSSILQIFHILLYINLNLIKNCIYNCGGIRSG